MRLQPLNRFGRWGVFQQPVKCVGNGRRVRCIEQLLVADAQGADSDALRIFIKRDLEFVLHFEFGNKKAPTSGA